MKLRILLSLFFIVCAGPLFAQTAAELSAEAQRAYVAGDMDTAKLKFRMALEIQPGNAVARNYLRMIQTREAKSGAGGQLEKQVRTVKIESVKFNEATLREALEYLKQQAAKQNVTVSFVTELPADVLAKPVTLNLSKVPLTEALRYLCEMIGARYAIEQFAIVLRPRGEEKAAVVSSPSPAQ